MSNKKNYPMGIRLLLHKRISIFIGLFLFSVLIIVSVIYTLRDGNIYQFNYITSVEPVEHRELSIKKDSKTGFYCIENEEGTPFRILQLTDIHIGGGYYTGKEDRLALEAVYKLIKRIKPDLIVITGDLLYATPSSFTVNNVCALITLEILLENIGIPWTCTFGNHDVDFFSTHDSRELKVSLSVQEHCLFVAEDRDQIIQIRNRDGSLNTALILMDSNSYTNNLPFRQYDNIHPDQVEWYEGQILAMEKEEGGPINSLLFFHIPLQEYKTAWELYKEGSDKVIYHFGLAREAIHCSPYPSAMFDKVVKLGSTKGIFCGHDHFNDFSITYKGIRLTYGKCVNYQANSGDSEDKRGGTLIEIHENGTFNVTTIGLSTQN